MYIQWDWMLWITLQFCLVKLTKTKKRSRVEQTTTTTKTRSFVFTARVKLIFEFVRTYFTTYWVVLCTDTQPYAVEMCSDVRSNTLYGLFPLYYLLQRSLVMYDNGPPIFLDALCTEFSSIRMQRAIYFGYVRFFFFFSCRVIYIDFYFILAYLFGISFFFFFSLFEHSISLSVAETILSFGV